MIIALRFSLQDRNNTLEIIEKLFICCDSVTEIHSKWVEYIA